jgi:basic amino acid/polyamine antiporter, APA family
MQSLKKSISFPLLVFYGLGTIVGGGIYALLGKVAGEAGMMMPLSFALAGVVALLSAYSFAELSTRYPISAGEAFYVLKGFNNQTLSTGVGVLVIFTGIVSAATLVVATSHFFNDLIAISPYIVIVLLVFSMGLVAAWGISQSAILVMLITLIEVGALFYICIVNVEAFGQFSDRWQEMIVLDSSDQFYWAGLFSGAFLAFYAFIGFEDMVNIAEEVKDVRIVMRKAIYISVGLATLLYILISVIAVLTVPIDILSQSNTPLTELVKHQPEYILTGLWLVSVLAGINGALVQIIMASRVVYGMSTKHLLSLKIAALFATVSTKTNTPIIATIFICGLVLALSLFFPVETLAKTTSAIIFIIFFMVNGALWRIETASASSRQKSSLTRWIPLLGCATSLAMLLTQLLNS